MTEGDISPNEVLARWVYSELLSDKYAHVQGIEQLLEQARRQVRFTDLAPTEHDLLVHAWKQVRGPLQPYFEGIEAFQLTPWGRENWLRCSSFPSSWLMLSTLPLLSECR